jgi:DNA-binding CsgD family transcriptional regulator
LKISADPIFFSNITLIKMKTYKDNLEEFHWFLSIRELEIVRLLAEGLASKQIADTLCISPNTVHTHRRNLLRKTGSKNMLELAVGCVKKGLI